MHNWMKHKKINYQMGNALIIVMMLFVAVSVSVSIGLTAPTISSVRSVKDTLESKRSYVVAESGLEDVFYRLRAAKSFSSTETITIGNQQVTTTVTDIAGGKKQINSVGDSNDRNRTIMSVCIIITRWWKEWYYGRRRRRRRQRPMR